jgi:transposase
MAPYPTELRTRVVAAVEQGDMTIGEVARVFNVGITFVKKMLRLSRAGRASASREPGGQDLDQVGRIPAGAEATDRQAA